MIWSFKLGPLMATGSCGPHSHKVRHSIVAQMCDSLFLSQRPQLHTYPVIKISLLQAEVQLCFVSKPIVQSFLTAHFLWTHAAIYWIEEIVSMPMHEMVGQHNQYICDIALLDVSAKRIIIQLRWKWLQQVSYWNQYLLLGKKKSHLHTRTLHSTMHTLLQLPLAWTEKNCTSHHALERLKLLKYISQFYPMYIIITFLVSGNIQTPHRFISKTNTRTDTHI